MRYICILFLLSLLCIDIPVYPQDTLIHAGESWKYFDRDTIPEFNWFANNYPDSDWMVGKAPLGYGQGNEATILNFGTNPQSKRITNYFRKSFFIDNPDKYFVYLIRLMRDDGAVVYVNGREVWRSNMPDGFITETTCALMTISDEQETEYYEHVLSPDYFIEGENYICVSVHQSRAYTSDCSFDLELIRHNDLFSVNHLLSNRQTEEQIINRSFSLLSFQLELENKNNEINHLKLRNDNLRNYGIFLIFVLFILLLIVFYLIIKNIKLSHRLENQLQKIKNELSQKNKELINYALNIVQLKQFFKLIKEELGAFSKKIQKDKIAELDRIILKISYYDDHEDEWERLKSHFDSVHSGFFSRLKEKFPTLTQSELQHCSYIKLQLPTKEIARMLNIDPKSVQASRYRIKKKMELPLETDLREVIESF